MPWKGGKVSTVIDPSEFFECQMCGDCCKGYGGTFVTRDEIEAISRYLHIDPTTFLTHYCQWSGRRPVIRTAESGYCLFWDKVCTIHKVKPRMCKLWPFIDSILVDPANWAAMHSMCPGIRKKVSQERLIACVKQVLAEHEPSSTPRFKAGR